MTVWTHTQGVFPLRDAIAKMLGVEEEHVRCIHTEGSGCYGHNGADDVAADAALIAASLPGRPVRVQWMREQEHTWEPYGSAMITKVRATVQDGRVSSWQYDVWSSTHSTRPSGNAGNLLAARHLAQPHQPPPPRSIPLPDGGGDRNAIPLYTFANARVVHHFIPAMPLRVSSLRSLGAYMNVFTTESAMEELAAQADVDPVEFRLRHLDDPRARAVVEAAAEGSVGRAVPGAQGADADSLMRATRTSRRTSRWRWKRASIARADAFNWCGRSRLWTAARP